MVAVLDLGSGLVALTIAALAGCIYVDGHLLVDPLCCLCERQLHHVLDTKKRLMIEKGQIFLRKKEKLLGKLILQ